MNNDVQKVFIASIVGIIAGCLASASGTPLAHQIATYLIAASIAFFLLFATEPKKVQKKKRSAATGAQKEKAFNK